MELIWTEGRRFISSSSCSQKPGQSCWVFFPLWFFSVFLGEGNFGALNSSGRDVIRSQEELLQTEPPAAAVKQRVPHSETMGDAADDRGMRRTFIVPAIKSFDHYDFTRAKISCSLTWLVAKAFGSGRWCLAPPFPFFKIYFLDENSGKRC